MFPWFNITTFFFLMQDLSLVLLLKRCLHMREFKQINKLIYMLICLCKNKFNNCPFLLKGHNFVMIVATLTLQWSAWKVLYWLAKYGQFSGVALSKCCLRNFPCLLIGVSVCSNHSFCSYMTNTYIWSYISVHFNCFHFTHLSILL